MMKIDEVRWIIRIYDVMRNAVETLQCIEMDEEEANLQARTLMGYCNALEDIASAIHEKKDRKDLMHMVEKWRKRIAYDHNKAVQSARAREKRSESLKDAAEKIEAGAEAANEMNILMKYGFSIENERGISEDV